LQWWSDEISWLFGQRVNQVSEYQNTERVGRGTSIRLSVSDRSIVWSVFEDYSQWLKDTGQEDYDNPGGLVFDLLSSDESELPENLRYDHVLIDEVQDFDRSWLLAAAKIPRVSLCLAGDIAQRIYKRNFTWKSVGIKVQGQRTRLLGSTHRATKQTMDVASC
jgi:superfamily I DNA/RNA helicase